MAKQRLVPQSTNHRVHAIPDFTASGLMALYTLPGRSKDGVDELTGFITGKEPVGYHAKTD
jgi:hypothetical protein